MVLPSISSDVTRKSPRRAALTLVVLLSLIPRLLRLDRSIWYDEYCRTFGSLNAETLVDRLFHDVHNPLYNALMYVWINVFGDSEVSIRVPSLIAGYLSIWVFCRWLSHRFSPAIASLVGVWALFSPVHIWHSTEAKNNIFVLMFAMFVLVAYDRLSSADGVEGTSSSEEERTPRWRVLAAVIAGAGAIYTDFVTLLALAPVALWSLGVARKTGDRPALQRVLLTLGLTILLVLPLLIFKAANIDDVWRGYLTRFRPQECLHLVASHFFCGNSLVVHARNDYLPSIIGAILVMPLLAIGSRSLLRLRHGRVIVASFGFAIFSMLILSGVLDAMFIGNSKMIYQPRNLLLIFYLYATILASGAMAIRIAWLRHAIVALLFAINISASTLMVTAYSLKWTVDKQTPDWRSIAATIEQDAASRAVVIWSQSPIHPLTYYLDAPRVTITWGNGVDVPQLAAAARVSSNESLYYVDDLYWFPLAEQQTHALIAAGFEEFICIDDVKVYRVRNGH